MIVVELLIYFIPKDELRDHEPLNKLIYNNFDLYFETTLLGVRNLKICNSMEYTRIRNLQFYMTGTSMFCSINTLIQPH